MLAKLISYELKQYASTFLILAIAAVVGTILIATPLVELPYVDIILIWLNAGLFFIVLAYVASAIYTSWANLYKGKATFELMLPTTALEKLVSKLIAALIWILVGILIYCISLFGFVVLAMAGSPSAEALTDIFGEIPRYIEHLDVVGPWLLVSFVSLVLSSLVYAAIMFASISISSISPKFNDGLSILAIFVGWYIEGNILSMVRPENVGIGLVHDQYEIYMVGGVDQLFAAVCPYWIVLVVSLLVWSTIAWYLISHKFNVK